MTKRVLLVVVFLLGLAVGQTSNKTLSIYGCSESGTRTLDNTVKVCVVYDPYADKHFILSTIDTSNGAGIAIVEEK